MTRNVPALLKNPPVDIDELAREPKQMRACHDTGTPSVHSYLAYVRNRPIVARELRMDRGSIFVQNPQSVRIAMNEV